MSKRKQKYLTPDQVIDYIYEHKSDYNWVNKKVASFNHKRLDDYISEFIIGYLSTPAKDQVKFETTEELGKYLTKSMTNRVRTAFRSVGRYRNFIDQSMETLIPFRSSAVFASTSDFEVIEELLDLAVIAKKTWRPSVAEENLKTIMTIPDTDNSKELEDWYGKRKALIIRLYKTYRKKFRQKKEAEFVNPSAAAGIIEGCIETRPMRYPQKKNVRTKQMPEHGISLESLFQVSEVAKAQAERIRVKLDKSGFFNRLTDGGIVTNKERVDLEKKNKFNELVSISKKVKKLVSDKEMNFANIDSELIKKFIDLSSSLNLLPTQDEGAEAA